MGRSMMRALFTHRALEPAAVTALLHTEGFDVGPEESITRTLLDTFDGRLHAAGLRLEAEHGSATTLVLRERSGNARAARLPVDDVPRFGDLLPPGPVREQLAGVTRQRALLPRATVHARRSIATRRNHRGEVVVVVEIYSQLQVQTAPDSSQLPQVAVELHVQEGHRKPAERAAGRLQTRELTRTDGDLVDLAAAVAGVDLQGWRSSPTVPLEASDSAGEALSRVLRNLADAIEANVDGAATDLDREFLHDLRVAVRRTRSVIAETRDLVPGTGVQTHRAMFDWLATVTGPARDLDVHQLAWDRYVDSLGAAVGDDLEPVRQELERRRAEAHTELTTALRSERFGAGMGAWRAWLDALATGLPTTAEPIGPAVAERIHKAQRRLLRDGRAITPASPAEALHDLRKEAKRLRYLLECFGGLLVPKRRKSFVARLQVLQDNLGAHQDSEIHAALTRSMALDLHAAGAAGPVTLLAAGQLIELLERRRSAARNVFAGRFTTYDSSGARRELDALLAPLRTRA